MGGGVGLVRVLCLGGFVLTLLLPTRPVRRDRRAADVERANDSISHRRLMDELRRYD